MCCFLFAFVSLFPYFFSKFLILYIYFLFNRYFIFLHILSLTLSLSRFVSRRRFRMCRGFSVTERRDIECHRHQPHVAHSFPMVPDGSRWSLMVSNGFQRIPMGPTGTGTAPSVVHWSLVVTADELEMIIFLHFAIGREAKRYPTQWSMHYSCK